MVHNDAGDDSKLLVLVVATGSTTDTDGDGVPDNLDAYPTDATRSFNSYYPNETDLEVLLLKICGRDMAITTLMILL